MMTSLISVIRRARTCLITSCFLLLSLPLFSQTQTIAVLADRDSRFKIAGKSNPQMTLKAGESVILRITAVKGKTWNKGGVVHGFTLVRLKERTKVLGWNLELKQGVQEFTLIAPSQPGEYEILCTVICSEEHEGMRMKVLVTP
jgi:heme/copper-type cytochrome/quinol oxidase subunit 2